MVKESQVLTAVSFSQPCKILGYSLKNIRKPRSFDVQPPLSRPHCWPYLLPLARIVSLRPLRPKRLCDIVIIVISITVFDDTPLLCHNGPSFATVNWGARGSPRRGRDSQPWWLLYRTCSHRGAIHVYAYILAQDHSVDYWVGWLDFPFRLGMIHIEEVEFNSRWLRLTDCQVLAEGSFIVLLVYGETSR